MVYAGGMTDEHRDARKNRSLLKVEGEGWDVGNGVLYLVSDEARWVTGIVLPVDAGASAAPSAYPAPPRRQRGALRMSASDHVIAAPAPAGPGIAARLDRAIGTALELAAACAGGGGNRHPVRRHRRPLRVPQPADLVGRTGLDAVPVARHAGRRAGAAAQRAHADDRLHRARAGAFARHSSSMSRCSRSSASCSALLRPAIAYVDNESIVSLMSLDISMSWRASAMPVGVGLMIVTALLRIDPREQRRGAVPPSLIGGRAVRRASGCCTRCSRRLAG